MNPENPMKPTPEEAAALARKIADAEHKLQQLEWEIEEIGQPAAHELQRRLDTLKIEEQALKRNLEEALGMHEPDDARMAKIHALLAHIEREENSVEHDAGFLHQSPVTSSEVATQIGAKVVDLCLRALKRVVGEHHPLGMSAFVNHNRVQLEEQFGLKQEPK